MLKLPEFGHWIVIKRMYLFFSNSPEWSRIPFLLEKPRGQCGEPSWQRRYREPGMVAVEQDLAPYPALTAATHLGFQFRDLQVQFIQVFVHKGDESLKEKHRPATEMEALGSGRPWRLPP